MQSDRALFFFSCAILWGVPTGLQRGDGKGWLAHSRLVCVVMYVDMCVDMCVDWRAGWSGGRRAEWLREGERERERGWGLVFRV